VFLWELPHVFRVLQVVVQVQHVLVLGQTEHLEFHVFDALRDEIEYGVALVVEFIPIYKVQEWHKFVAMFGHSEGTGGHHPRKDAVHPCPSNKLHEIVGQSERQIPTHRAVFLLYRIKIDRLLLL